MLYLIGNSTIPIQVNNTTINARKFTEKYIISANDFIIEANDWIDYFKAIRKNLL